MASVYGASQARPQPWDTPKDPDEEQDYSFNFDNEMATGESLLSVLATNADAGITIDSTVVSGNVVTYRVSGGTAGRRYKIACRFQTTSGRTVEYTGLLKVAQR